MKSFEILPNEYLKSKISAYFSVDYVGFQKEGNPDYLNKIKNQFNKESEKNLKLYKKQIVEQLIVDLPQIIEKESLDNCVIACVPRAKADHSYNQLYFKHAVQESTIALNLTDGTDAITRTINTKTTHLRDKISNNDGDYPYPRITEQTCKIDKTLVNNKNIILIDDIYTHDINIDEDCIQALLNLGAKKVVFYAIAKTVRRNLNDIF